MNGLLVLDKPCGVTSHDVVSIVRRATGEKSIGHLGTLDPMATGVLPLLLGKYTRLAQFFGQAAKEYSGHIRFGFATDSFDAEGAPSSEAMPLTRSFDELREMSCRFRGEMDQMPPIFSAKRTNGVAAHKLGEMAGCGAHLSSLRRVRAGAFTLAQAITVDQLKQASVRELEALLPHPRLLLPEMPAVTVDDQLAGRLRNGMQVNLPDFSDAPLIKVFTSPTDLLAIARRVAGTLMQPIVVIG
jgi:tRNA pseudouridine55 synthase